MRARARRCSRGDHPTFTGMQGSVGVFPQQHMVGAGTCGTPPTACSPEGADQGLDEVGGEPAGAGLRLAVVLQQGRRRGGAAPECCWRRARLGCYVTLTTHLQALPLAAHGGPLLPRYPSGLTSPITGFTASVAFSRW